MSEFRERAGLEVTLKLPPRSRAGGRYKSDDHKAWEVEAHWDIVAAIAPNLPARRPKAPLLLEMWFYFVGGAPRYADDLMTSVKDLVARSVGFDDSDVTDVFLCKRIDKENPRCEVILTELPQSHENGAGEPARRVVGVEPQKGNWRDLMEEE